MCFLYNNTICHCNGHMWVIQNIFHYLFKRGKFVSIHLFIVQIWQICSCQVNNYLVSCKWQTLAVPLIDIILMTVHDVKLYFLLKIPTCLSCHVALLCRFFFKDSLYFYIVIYVIPEWISVWIKDHDGIWVHYGLYPYA